MRTKFLLAGTLALVGALLVGAAVSAQVALTEQQLLGKHLFFDTNLSEPPGESCATCHAPSVGYTGPNSAINAAGAVYEGAVAGRFGNRKPPAAAYAGDSPLLHFDGDTWVGGMFWDGRATGAMLGDPLAEQALGPFLNPLEQNVPDSASMVARVQASSYASLFAAQCPGTDTYELYVCMGRAIAAYERSVEVSPYTSKYDYWLEGKAKLTGQEDLGRKLFFGKAKCSGCHVPPNFTDFTYDNLGVPKNPLNPFYSEPDWNPLGAAWVDEGLGGYLKAMGYPASVYEEAMGKFKVPTLRNVDLRPNKNVVKAYGHNGYFKSLYQIVHFYNTRDVPWANWPAPEVAANVNTTELGNLKLTVGEELAIVQFLRTLSDGYVVK
jgi:cytochrome c peroxidase